MNAADLQIAKLTQEKKMLTDSIANAEGRLAIIDVQLTALQPLATPAPAAEPKAAAPAGATPAPVEAPADAAK